MTLAETCSCSASGDRRGTSDTATGATLGFVLAEAVEVTVTSLQILAAALGAVGPRQWQGSRHLDQVERYVARRHGALQRLQHNGTSLPPLLPYMLVDEVTFGRKS